MSLITLGTIALDTIHTPSGIKKNLLGGSASHFAMSARLFTKVHLVSVVGKDFPNEHIQFFKKKGINLNSVIEREENTFAWTGEYRKGDFNSAITLQTELGVLEKYYPQVALEHRDIPNVFLANFDPDIQEAFLHLMKKPKFVGMDTMNLWIDIKNKSVKRLMKKVDLFICNDSEGKMLTEETNLHKVAKAIRKLGPKMVCVKKGEHGVLFYSDKIHFSLSAFPVEQVLDPTGAGDTFAGALMGYLTKVSKITEDSIRKGIIYAIAISSFNVEDYGMLKTAHLTMPIVHKRMKHLLKHITP